jgi:hypothetical protein
MIKVSSAWFQVSGCRENELLASTRIPQLDEDFETEHSGVFAAPGFVVSSAERFAPRSYFNCGIRVQTN